MIFICSHSRQFVCVFFTSKNLLYIKLVIYCKQGNPLSICFDSIFKMKYQIFSITLLLILIFNIFRFEIPYIEYAIFKPYIVKNLCENKDKPHSCCEGKCFREKQLKQINSTHETETTNEKNSNKTPQTKESKEFLQTHTLLPQVAELSFNHPVLPENVIETRFVFVIFVPPQF